MTYTDLSLEYKRVLKTEQVKRFLEIVELLKKMESEQGSSTGNCLSGNYKKDLLK